jgi:hypothetical protein
VEALCGLAQVVGVVRENRAGQAVLRVVGQAQRVLEIARLGDRQDRAENLFLEDSGARLDIRNDGGRDEIAAAGDNATGASPPPPGGLPACRSRCIRGWSGARFR